MMIETRTDLDRPTIFGADGAGVVHAVGPGVAPSLLGTDVVVSPSMRWGESPAAPGDDYEVLGAPTDGTHAEYVARPAENVFAKPARLTWSEAAALPMAGLTAWRALVTRGRLRESETVVIAAATSGVGSMAIQIAAGLGARVVAITSTDDKAGDARALGAAEVVLRGREDFVDRLVEATRGQAHLALDPTGALCQPRHVVAATAGFMMSEAAMTLVLCMERRWQPTRLNALEGRPKQCYGCQPSAASMPVSMTP